MHQAANGSVMRDWENKIAAAARDGKIIQFKAIPHYTGTSIIPDSVKLIAFSKDGTFKLNGTGSVTIANVP